MNGMVGDDKPLSCLIPGGSDRYARLMTAPDFPLLRAARRQRTAFTPIWLMRQAGRFLPEYRAMRARYGFLELCKNPDAAAEVTLQPVDRLGVDAAILFADILLLVEPLGVGLEFARGAGAVQVFDSWVGTLSPADYRTFVQPHVAALIKAITPGVPVIHFGTGTATLLPLMREAGGDVIGLDWRVELDTAWAAVGHDVAVQGNLDPVVLMAKPSYIRERVADILRRAGGRPGPIFNLGHGVLPDTPVDHVKALVDMVHEMSSKR